MERLRKRADFLKVAKGRSVRMTGFVLQFLPAPAGSPRIGFTVTKRQGNAVVRNRIKRRLRAAAHICAKAHPFPTGDYVLIGRETVLKMPFSALQADLVKALQRTQNG